MKSLIPFCLILVFLSLFACVTPPESKVVNTDDVQKSIRFAAYNVALFRSDATGLAKDLKSGTDKQIQNVGAVIQKVRPDVLALLEFDYDASGQLLHDFQENYLKKSQQGQEGITYAYQFQVVSNTGVLSGKDYNNDGKIALPNDAYGFGKYEGQYAFALLSKFPLDTNAIRSFQQFLWKDMPDAKQPKNENGTSYYTDEAWEIFRLSSKNHIDIPIILPNKTIHTIIAHPTPPVFDGPEDRNGCRNYDEIRLLKDYVANEGYIVDDQGQKGGLESGSSFVIMGDLNADPIDGDSYPGAINQLLTAPPINQTVSTGKLIPASKGGKIYNRKAEDKGDPAYDTAFFGARIDYVLPSNNLTVQGSGVFWPEEGAPLYEIVKEKGASDHLLVWVDLIVE